MNAAADQPEDTTVTVIDYGVARRQLSVSGLNRIQRVWLHRLLDKCEHMYASGCQEVIGSVGRDTVVAMGGSWDKVGQVAFFQVSSFGGVLDGEWVYSSEDGVMIRPPKQ